MKRSHHPTLFDVEWEKECGRKKSYRGNLKATFALFFSSGGHPTKEEEESIAVLSISASAAAAGGRDLLLLGRGGGGGLFLGFGGGGSKTDRWLFTAHTQRLGRSKSLPRSRFVFSGKYTGSILIGRADRKYAVKEKGGEGAKGFDFTRFFFFCFFPLRNSLQRVHCERGSRGLRKENNN